MLNHLPNRGNTVYTAAAPATIDAGDISVEFEGTPFAVSGFFADGIIEPHAAKALNGDPAAMDRFWLVWENADGAFDPERDELLTALREAIR